MIVNELIALAVLLATHNNVDPRLFCNIIREESRWDQYANSGVAKGLCQINQDAWDWWPANPYAPKANMRMGLTILLFNLKYREDPEVDPLEQQARAVASYNLGHGRVDRLIAEYGDHWREYMPEENQRYLEAVLNLEVTDAPNP